MNILTIYGLISVTAMLVFYALEHKSHWFILAFSLSCILASIYGFWQGAWPFGLVELVWSGVALRRWFVVKRTPGGAGVSLAAKEPNSGVSK